MSFAHNAKSYDLQLVISAISQIKDDRIKYMKSIPASSEKFIMLTMSHYCFKDMMSFCPASLDTLVQDLMERKGNVDILRQSVLMKTNEKFSQKKFEISTRKLAFPYEFITNKEVLKMTELPPIEKFYSSLKEKTVTQEEYNHAQQFWKVHNCKNLGSFAIKYCHTDSLLSSAVFFDLRDWFYDWSGLDAARYMGLPGIAHDTFLKTTKVKIKLLTDKDMMEMIERGIRGGFCVSGTKYLEESEGYAIIYIDMNNL